MKKFIACLFSLLLILGLTACGQAATVRIIDDGIVTELETKLPRTIDKILEEAGITLGEKDVVTPELDTKMTEVQDIVVDRMHEVKLTLDGKTDTFEIVGGNVEDLIKTAGISLKENQITSVGMDEPLKDGMEVKIINKYTISVTYDGKTEEQFVSATNIGDALKECGITLGEDDRVNPSADKAVTDGLEITVDRVKIEEVTETETIDYEIQYEYDSSQSTDYEYTRVAGETGEREVKYKVTYVNGEEEDREAIEETVTKEPVTAVVVVGTYSGPYVVSRIDYPNCNGDGHGYYEVEYSDGSKEYIDY